MNITPATINDAENIAHLHATSWQGIYQGLLNSDYLKDGVFSERGELWQTRFTSPQPNQRVYIATLNNQLCGFICIYLDQDKAWGTLIENLHVNPSFKGQGIGRTLLHHAAKQASAQANIDGMYLEVLAGNTSAQAFYQYLGAYEAKAQQWQAPEGSTVDEFVYRWDSITTLLNA
ncbi:GNAT family N-acetyltransferase [Photobacterium sanctipauli]|uniref:GNAT family N-acetyltransferase n=1 Tax=Photobacterium sanctipauli TaxID=1342794 RepID=A0A2T3P0J4_9GAMM|nr:GNAT family N-acetyltransferase [Photobacterium sanctipauli]PSW22046.1 GNAT family N-acetyltransferase [Photobacterium sanctipauli]